MKRHTQVAGVRHYYGEDFIELQSEPLRVLDAIFAPYGNCIVQGCETTATGNGKYNVSAGVVALAGKNHPVMVMPFAGINDAALPIYLTAKTETITRAYDDGNTKPVIYNYTAEATGVRPSSTVPSIEIRSDGTTRFLDAIQNSNRRFVTDAERQAWNLKVDRETGKGLSTNDFTSAEKSKLAGIADQANKYTLPAASASALGGVKVGSGLKATVDGNLSLDTDALPKNDPTKLVLNGGVPAPTAGEAMIAKNYFNNTRLYTTRNGTEVNDVFVKQADTVVQNAIGPVHLADTTKQAIGAGCCVWAGQVNTGTTIITKLFGTIDLTVSPDAATDIGALMIEIPSGQYSFSATPIIDGPGVVSCTIMPPEDYESNAFMIATTRDSGYTEPGRVYLQIFAAHGKWPSNT